MSWQWRGDAPKKCGRATVHRKRWECGLLFALADTAFAFACNAYNRVTVAGSASIEFLRPAMLGDSLLAFATEDYRGRRSGYYTVRVDNQAGEAVALFRGRCVSRDEPVLDD